MTSAKLILPILLLLSVLAGGCDEPAAANDVTSEHISTEGSDERVSPHGKVRSSIPDQILELDVDYFNINSGSANSYTLEVDLEDGEPVRINFPNGGWTHVYPEDIGDSWECENEGATYTVHKPDDLDESSGDDESTASDEDSGDSDISDEL